MYPETFVSRNYKRYSVGSFVISCFFFGKSKNSLDFERRHHKL